ncbi:hypothetical protein HU200_005049 [Digitaria exilis]|uniref:F-box domain-containing protein n=1 Tax=Digitaria exilis TaxID=1010633 RepID=A0A835FTW3_9POAL|nr:hypothetical protein HU200_005049 [Digitaria exilis]
MLSCSYSHRKRPCSTAAATADWAALPPDILFTVFLKLGQHDIFCGADSVCTSWRRIALGEPALWRHVDMTKVLLCSMRRLAIILQKNMNRSAGQCESFSGGIRCDQSMLTYVVQRAPSLKSLCLLDYRHRINVVGAIKKLPLLECLKVAFFEPACFEKTFQSVCEACPRLKKLSLRHICLPWAYRNKENIEIHGGPLKYPIPVMHELRSLRLIFYGFTEKKLVAIIDSCPVLEYLHIAPCISDEKVQELQARYARLKIVSAHY